MSAEEDLLFKTIYPKGSNVAQAKWIKTLDDVSTEIEFNNDCIKNSTSEPKTQYVKIPKAEDNNGAYQLCNDNMKSNIIVVFAYGRVQFICYNFTKTEKY